MEKKKEMIREDIDQKYKWRLTDIFKSDEEWEKAFKNLSVPVEKLLKLQNTLSDSPQNLADALEIEQECSILVMELYVYAKMSKDLDNSNSKYQGMFDRIIAEYYKVSATTAFLAPEISSIEEEKLRQWTKDEERLFIYKHSIDNLIRNKKHILSEKEERILSGAGPVAEGIEEAFSMLNNVELDFGEILFSDGSKEKLTHAKFGKYREHPDREVRRQAYENMHKSYGQLKNTIAAIYTTSVKGDIFFAKTREFESCVQKAMFSDNLDEKIYTSLIEAIHKYLPSFHKYLELRKKVLKLDELHLYDCSVPITEEISSHYEFEQGKEILNEALAPLGEKYIRDMNTLFSGGSIDVYETPGKTSGAYAWGTYKSHPYMLLNWSYRLEDVFTFAHETGHCMHSYNSNKTQEYVNSHYPIFLAEIASTVNENILLKYMTAKCDVKTQKGKKEKAYLINHFLEDVKNTVIRQTMFAEFEYIVHQKIEQGEAMTSESLCGLYEDLLKLYFGEGVVYDEYMNHEWSRIPHFYSSFYVYKYATGFCAAAKISQKIVLEGEVAVKKYLEFLSAGGSDYPANILGKLDIDMSEPDAVLSTMKEFDRKVHELEKLLLE